MNPTAEQLRALELFKTGESLAIEAGAGTGKTSTLQLLAESTSRRGQYVAFNRAIVQEAAARFPSNVSCRTAHSLAFRSVGVRYKHRLDSVRMRPMSIASRLSIRPLVIDFEGKPKRLGEGFLASRVMEAVGRFCQTADPAPTEDHFKYIDGIDLPLADGRHTFANNRLVRQRLARYVHEVWADLQRVDGWVPFKHDHYLKIFQLSRPRLEADFILADEAQDLSPVLLDIIQQQTAAQVVWVGDSQQEIYSFTGAVNALASVQVKHRCFLTQSFRFGPAIADVANGVLGDLEAELRLAGCDIASRLATQPLARPAAVLTRTNAEAVKTLIRYQAAGVRAFLVGGTTDVIAFAEAAVDLMAGRSTSHPELACFDSWTDVLLYVKEGDGDDLKLLVDLVTDNGPDVIIRALRAMHDERGAEVVISTAHKAKGREWSSVQLAGDFNTNRQSTPAERRLLYVAVTRAREVLDILAMPSLAERHGLRRPRPVVADPPDPFYAPMDEKPTVPAKVVHPAPIAHAQYETCPRCSSVLSKGIMRDFRKLRAADDKRTCPECPRTGARLAEAS